MDIKQKIAEIKRNAAAKAASSKEHGGPTADASRGSVPPRRPSRRPALPPSLTNRISSTSKPQYPHVKRISQQDKNNGASASSSQASLSSKDETPVQGAVALTPMPNSSHSVSTASSSFTNTNSSSLFTPMTSTNILAGTDSKLYDDRTIKDMRKLSNEDIERELDSGSSPRASNIKDLIEQAKTRLNEVTSRPPTRKNSLSVDADDQPHIYTRKASENKVKASPALRAVDEDFQLELSTSRELQQKITLLQTTLASTEERFQDSRERHRSELSQLRDEHEAEISALQSRIDKQLKSLKSIDSLQHQLDESQAELSQLETVLSETTLAHEQKYAALEEDMKAREQESENLISSLKSKIVYMEHELDEARKESDGNATRVQELEVQLSTLRRNSVSLEDLDRIQQEYENEIDNIKRRLSEATVQLDAVTQERDAVIEENEHFLENFDVEREKLTAEVETERKLRMARDADLTQAEQVVQDMDEQVNALKEASQKSLLQNSALLAQVDEFKLKVQDSEAVKGQLAEAQEALETLTAEKEQLYGKIMQAEQDLETMQLDFQHADADHKAALAEANKNIEDLFTIYETVQAENASLQSRLNKISSENLSAAEFKKDHANLEEDLKYWADYCEELNQVITETEKQRVELKNEFDAFRAQTVRASAKFISTDSELLSFIEQTQAKVEQYRTEIQELLEEREKLQQELAAVSSKPYVQRSQPRGVPDRNGSVSDSAYESSSPTLTTHSQTSKPHLAMRDDFAEREAVLMKDLEAALKREERIQKEFNEIQSEFDRLSVALSSSEAEKHKILKTVEKLTAEIAGLQERLHSEMAKNLGLAPGKDEPVSVVNMRREFRKALDDVRKEHSASLQKETAERLEAEKQLRAVRRERDTDSFSKVAQSTQTLASMTDSKKMY